MAKSIEELQAAISKMETGLSNPNIPDATKEIIQGSLEKAKGELAELQKEDQPNPSPEPKSTKLLKKDFYTAMDEAFPSTTKNGLAALGQSEYEKQYKSFLEKATSIAENKDQAINYLAAWLEVHIAKGTATKPTSKKTKSSKAPTATSTPKILFDWKKKVEVSGLKPVAIKCQHYSLKVEKETKVKLKGSGNESIEVTAMPGEYLIFDDKGYLVFIMEAKSFATKCALNKTVEAYSKELLGYDQIMQHLQKANKDIEELNAELEEAKVKAQKPKDEPTPSKKPNPKPKKKAVCTLEEGEMGRRLAKAIKFFTDHAEKWHKSKVSYKITKIYKTKGEKQEVIIETADYKGMITGLRTLIGQKRNYYKLCLDSLNLTKVDKPKAGSYVLLVKSNEMKKVYTTKGEKIYAICLKTYRELLKCSFEGKCTAEQSAKWKKLYQECGDLQQKLEQNPEVLRNFHKEVKKRRKVGELYSDAMTRVAGLIKEGKI